MTSPPITVRIPSQGAKNATVEISGVLEADIGLTPVVTLRDFDPAPPRGGLRVDAVIYQLQEKLGVLLWWEEGARLMFPAESRGRVDFGVMGGLVSPQDWNGVIWMESFNFGIDPTAKRKHFLIMLDLEKL